MLGLIITEHNAFEYDVLGVDAAFDSTFNYGGDPLEEEIDRAFDSITMKLPSESAVQRLEFSPWEDMQRGAA